MFVPTIGNGHLDEEEKQTKTESDEVETEGLSQLFRHGERGQLGLVLHLEGLLERVVAVSVDMGDSRQHLDQTFVEPKP